MINALTQASQLLSEYETISAEASIESFARQREISLAMQSLSLRLKESYPETDASLKAEIIATLYRAWNALGPDGTFHEADRFILSESRQLLKESAAIALPEEVILNSILYSDDDRYRGYFSRSASRLADRYTRESDPSARHRLLQALRALPIIFSSQQIREAL